MQHRLWTIYQEYASDPAFVPIRSHHPPKHLVPGRGSMTPRIVIVGEAPGRTEAVERRPFVGAAGRVLDRILERMDLTRRDVFITNIVKYRPTVGEITIRNRRPTTVEVTASVPYIAREIRVFGRGVPVLVLGNTPLKALYHPHAKISLWSGSGWYDDERTYAALYHPAVACYEPSRLDDIMAHVDQIRHLLAA